MIWLLLSIFLLADRGCCMNSTASSQVPCTTYKDCISCESAEDSLGPCVWCQLGSTCYSSVNICPVKLRTQISYNCPMNASTIPHYNETFAKEIALPLMAASAAPDHETRTRCLGNHFGDMLILENYTVPCNLDNTTKCFAFISYWPTRNAIIVTFRASTMDQVLTQIIGFIFENMCQVPVVGGSIDIYYHDAFSKFWELMEPHLRDAVNTYTDAEVWFFGHSLGGGLASVTSAVASAVKLVPASRIKLITFGHPRIMDNIFSEQHDKLVPYSFRIVSRYDGIVSLPARMSEFQKIGPFHHRYEVWYPDGMDPGARFVVSTIPEDGFGHESTAALLDVNDHKMMFGKEVSSWWEQECKE